MTVFFCVSLFICVDLRASAVGLSDGDIMTRDRAQVSTGTRLTIFLCLQRPRKRGALHDVLAGALISSIAPVPALICHPLVRRAKNRAMRITRSVLAVMMLSCAGADAGTQEQLETCRQQIDSLDQKIVELIQERASVVKQVGEIKRAANLPVTVPSREKQVIAKVEDLAKAGPLPSEAVGRIYQELITEMRNWEATTSAGKQ
jgi:chorismate mutase-like protein